MRTLQTLAVIALSLCMIQSADAAMVGGGVSGSGWLPGGGLVTGMNWTKAEHQQAMDDAVNEAHFMLDIHAEIEMLGFPKQQFADRIVLDDHMGFHPDAPAHYQHTVLSYLLIFESGHSVVIEP